MPLIIDYSYLDYFLIVFVVVVWFNFYCYFTLFKGCSGLGLLRYQIRQFEFYFKEVHTYIISILFLYKTIYLLLLFLSRAESGHHLGLEWLRSLASMWSRHWIEKDATMIVINIKKIYVILNICQVSI